MRSLAWPATLLAGMVGIAIFIATLGGLLLSPHPSVREHAAEIARLDDLRGQASALAGRLARDEQLARATAALDDAPDGITWVAGPDLASREGWEIGNWDAVRAAYLAVRAEALSDEPVSMVWYVGSEPDPRLSDGSQVSKNDLSDLSAFVADRVDGHPFCARFERPFVGGPQIAARAGEDAATLLGSCLWLIRYGIPGPEIGTWFGSNGAAMGRAAPPETNYPTGVIDLDEGMSMMLVVQGAAATNLVHGEKLPASICRARGGESCADNFRTEVDWNRPTRSLNPLPDDEVAVAGVSRTWGYHLLSPDLDATVLQDLEAEFGREAFHTFWSSDRSPAAAFEQAFDVSAAEWNRARLLRAVGELDPGPSPKLGTLGSVALTLLLGLLVGGAVSARRSVG